MITDSLKDRITGDIDVYYRKTIDLINEIPVPAGTNLTNYITTNVGDLENRGAEFSINGNVIATDRLQTGTLVSMQPITSTRSQS